MNVYQELGVIFGAKRHQGLYPTDAERPTVFHTHTNFLVALGLWCGGYRAEATEVIKGVQESNLINYNGYYNYSFSPKEGPLLRHHSYDGAIAAYVLAVMGEKKQAKSIIGRYFNSPMYQRDTGLFIRSIWSDKKIADDRLIAQTNLWFVLALISADQKKVAKELLNRIHKHFCVTPAGLLSSISCESNTSTLYPDDNALFAICLTLLGEEDRARDVLHTLADSGLFNKDQGVFWYEKDGDNTKKHVSLYKNHIVQAAFRRLGIQLPAFNFNAGELYADSLALDLWRP